MLRLRFCSVEWTEEGSATTFEGGICCPSIPHPNDHHYHVISHRLGYAGDVMRYCREHELAHAIIAEEFAHSPPLALLETAKYGAALNWGYNIMEECTAHILQRWVRSNERPIIGNCDWDRIKARFLECVAQLDGELQ